MFADASLFHDLAQFGLTGIVIAFLVYKDIRADHILEKTQNEHRAELRLMEEKRLAYDRERLATDKEYVAAITALASSNRDKS